MQEIEQQMEPAVREEEFRKVSKDFHKKLSKEDRHSEGIYFTPKKVRTRLFDVLQKEGVKPTKILEPSFGSGEFLLDLRTKYPNADILGVEKNSELYETVGDLEFDPGHGGIDIINEDFLDWRPEEKVDLIVGNPPYFVVSLDKAEKKKYETCMVGRPNIYILFLYKCLENHLTQNGYLAFVIPTTLYNCSYYQPMRDYIEKNTTIVHVETIEKAGFYETGQETMLLVLQKKKDSTGKYIFKAKNGNSYISPYSKELYESVKGSKTLKELGLGVKTGNIVWNQVKEKLTHDASKGKLLVYASNIKDSTLKINNLRGEEKKQYIHDIEKPTLEGPVILVERGYGNSYSFSCVYIEDLKDFYAENHLNVIYAKEKGAEKYMKKVVEGFQNPKAIEFIEKCIGSGSVSATDLETLVPIYID